MPFAGDAGKALAMGRPAKPAMTDKMTTTRIVLNSPHDICKFAHRQNYQKKVAVTARQQEIATAYIGKFAPCYGSEG